MPPWKLTDSDLVTALRKKVSLLGCGGLSDKASGTNYEHQLAAALDKILASKHFSASDFSLLKYSAQCREEGEDGLFDLWKLALLSALHVLKWHDRRENVDRKQKVTPPVIDDLVRYYTKLRKYEPLLYGSDQFYRDH